MEMQLHNISKQKESLKKQIESLRDEYRCSKENSSSLQREVIEYQHRTESFWEELNVKVGHFITL